MRPRRFGIGVPIAVAALTLGLWAGGCGFGGGGGDTTAAKPSHSIAQVLVLRGGEGGKGPLQVLLLRHGRKVFFNPGAWVFPTGAVNSGDTSVEAAKAAAVRVLADEGGVQVPPASLVPYAQWVIAGFDTRFYLALAPADAKPRPDGSQTVAAQWFEPQRALDLHDAGKLKLVYGVVKQLESLRGFPTAADALQEARSTEVTPVQLRVIGQGDKQRAVLPEDAP
jgi:ADP-ribose pyrophosphatase YjhB (NUDIX family)